MSFTGLGSTGLGSTGQGSTAKGSTVLAFDYGLKNIGLAVGEAMVRSASELPPIRARDGIPNWTELEQRLKEWQPSLCVIGLPLNMDGSESEMSRLARKFGNRVNGRFGAAIEFIDERLSTREAKAIARDQGHKGHYREKPIDSIAAVVLLKAWWEQAD